jgi:hypothetical protein
VSKNRGQGPTSQLRNRSADPAENVTGWGLWRDLLTRLDAFFGHARQVRLLG